MIDVQRIGHSLACASPVIWGRVPDLIMLLFQLAHGHQGTQVWNGILNLLKVCGNLKTED